MRTDEQKENSYVFKLAAIRLLCFSFLPCRADYYCTTRPRACLIEPFLDILSLKKNSTPLSFNGTRSLKFNRRPLGYTFICRAAGHRLLSLVFFFSIPEEHRAGIKLKTTGVSPLPATTVCPAYYRPRSLRIVTVVRPLCRRHSVNVQARVHRRYIQ